MFVGAGAPVVGAQRNRLAFAGMTGMNRAGQALSLAKNFSAFTERAGAAWKIAQATPVNR